MEPNFGQYLKSIRKAAKFSMAVLAEKSGVSQPYISQIERGERGPSPEILKKLAAALNISYAELMLKAGYVPEELSQNIDRLTLLKGLQTELQQATKRQLQADKDLEVANRELQIAEYELQFLEELERVKDLSEFLKKPGITYMGKTLSDHDRMRVTGVIKYLFAEE
ncbi:MULTISPECIES: helix-turn-helix domain-containing protein [Paenibacillus]|uniref:helix-turn-helix domain-containing protein n=1 Tax=Paenibacillus TaxID=44249 RepID=UPI00157578E8|nr:helix-turn-helix transcriptional regulator [Paenibacillus sp. JMULE4]NTZ19899.1 XRE family transcriptional regulator [Paenibacillus sp. JMULE4]